MTKKNFSQEAILRALQLRAYDCDSLLKWFQKIIGLLKKNKGKEAEEEFDALLKINHRVSVVLFDEKCSSTLLDMATILKKKKRLLAYFSKIINSGGNWETLDCKLLMQIRFLTVQQNQDKILLVLHEGASKASFNKKFFLELEINYLEELKESPKRLESAGTDVDKISERLNQIYNQLTEIYGEERRTGLLKSEILDELSRRIVKVKSELEEAKARLEENIQDKHAESTRAFKKYADALENKMEKVKADQEKSLEEQKRSNIELLGIFSAILAFIFISVNIATQFSFVGALFLMIALVASVTIFFSVIYLLFHEKTKKCMALYLIIASISILLLLPVLAKLVSLELREIRNLFIKEEVQKIIPTEKIATESGAPELR